MGSCFGEGKKEWWASVGWDDGVGGGRGCTLHYTHSLVVGSGMRTRYSQWMITIILTNHINQFSVELIKESKFYSPI